MRPVFFRESKTIATHYIGATEHEHANCEILLAIEGEAENVVNGVANKLIGGQALFLNTSIVHELKGTGKNHRHRDIYISTEHLRAICLEFFDEEFFDFLKNATVGVKIDLSREEFASLVIKTHEIELEQSLAQTELAQNICKKCTGAIVVEVLGTLYKDMKFKREYGKNKLSLFLEQVRTPAVFTLPLAKIIPLSNYSRVHLERLFKMSYGKSFKTYINELRLGYALELISSTQKSVSEIAMEVGYQSESYFIQLFKKHTGTTPLQLRNN